MVDSVVDDKSKFSTGNESADILFSCETFEVIDLLSNGPALLFGSYTGHHIEFKVKTSKYFIPINIKTLFYRLLLLHQKKICLWNVKVGALYHAKE